MANIYDHLKELTKIEIEYTDPCSSKTYILFSHIKRLDDSEMLIDPPSINGIVCNLEIGQYIKIMVKGDDGIYVGSSSVAGKELSNSSGLLISYPTNIKFMQRREYVRVPLNVDITLNIVENNYNQSEKVVNIKTYDISATGFSYISDAPLGNYYSIKAYIHLDPESAPIETFCDYIYSRKFMTRNKEFKYKNAFMYTDMDTMDNEKLVKAIFKFQLEQRRKRGI